MAIRSDIAASADFFTGEDKSLVFTITQADGTTAQDITGWSLSWMVKKRKTDADVAAVLEKTTSAGITLTSPTSGVCTVSVADSDITAVIGGTIYHHELKRMDSGLESVLSYGTFILTQAVHS